MHHGMYLIGNRMIGGVGMQNGFNPLAFFDRPFFY